MAAAEGQPPSRPAADGEATQSPAPDSPADGLWYDAANEAAAETVVLLHGLGASHHEWALVREHLPQYHLLVPDMSGHAQSAHLSAVTVAAQAAAVADLITRHAHGGAAYVAALSMGGYVALELARTRPDLVKAAIVTGCAPFRGVRAFVGAHAGLVGASIALIKRVPRPLREPLKYRIARSQGQALSKDLADDMDRNYVPRLHKDVIASIGQVGMESLREITVRTLAMAGGKLDDVAATRQQGAALRHGCPESKAAVIKDAYHPWTMQFPALFAQLVVAWIERAPLPPEAVPLDSTDDAGV